jgi:hypothetical protein
VPVASNQLAPGNFVPVFLVSGHRILRAEGPPGLLGATWVGPSGDRRCRLWTATASQILTAANTFRFREPRRAVMLALMRTAWPGWGLLGDDWLTRTDESSRCVQRPAAGTTLEHTRLNEILLRTTGRLAAYIIITRRRSSTPGEACDERPRWSRGAASLVPWQLVDQ